MAWRVATSLITLRDQVNAFSPRRNKATDGTIGDAAHARQTSDHNPWIRDAGLGVVSALDLTHDPRNGVDTWLMAEVMRQSRDPRIKYVISNRRIFSSTVSPWTWRNYTGSSPHTGHVHISVNSQKALYDDARRWHLGDWAPGVGETDKARRPVLRLGSKGVYVNEWQTALDIDSDGDFGPITKRHTRRFQAQRPNELIDDGIVGPLTWAKMDAAENPGAPNPEDPDQRPVLRLGSYGEAVRRLQTVLMIAPIDGSFTEDVEREVIKFQTNRKLKADGIVDPQTWGELDTIEQLPRPYEYDEPQELSEPILHIPRVLGREDAPEDSEEDSEHSRAWHQV